jgi:hypothetical protein
MTFTSNEVTVDVRYAASDVRLEVTALADKEVYNKNEEAFFSVTVRNNGSQAVENVTVYLKGATDQLVGTIARIEANSSQSVSYTKFVDQSAAYNFEAMVTDSSNTVRRFMNVSPVNVEIAQENSGPEEPVITPDPNAPVGKFDVASPNTLVNTVIWIVVVLFVLMLISGGTYIVLRVKENKAKKSGQI